MVRPYLNKSDHDEFLAQYKLKRNQRIKKYLLIFGLGALVISTGAYFIFGNSSSPTSRNLPAYIGGEQDQDSPKVTEPQTELIASNQTPSTTNEGLEQALLVSEMEKGISGQEASEEEAIIPQEKERQNSESEVTNSLGTSRGGDPMSNPKTKSAQEESAIIRVRDESTVTEVPTVVETRGGMKRNPELDIKDEPPLFSAEKMPKFPGGYSALKRFIKTRLQIPKEAQKNKVNGTVQVQFIVNTGGTISNAKISKGLGYGCDEAAIALVKNMPKWIPGKQDGQTVAVYYNLPIKFNTK